MAESEALSAQLACIKGLYQQLIETHKHFHGESLSSAHVEMALNLSDQILAGLKSHPDALVAQLQFPKKTLPDAYNFGFNVYLLTALLCASNKINDTCAAQLICATISLVGLNQRRLQRYFSGKAHYPSLSIPPSLAKALKDTHYDVWLNGCEVGGWTSPPSAKNTSNALHTILYIALHLARLITPGQGRSGLSFAQAVKDAANRLSSFGYVSLEAFLNYPTPYPPGTLVKLNDGTLCRISGVHESGFLARPLPLQQTEHPFKRITSRQIQQSAAAKPASGFALALQLWDESWLSYAAEHSDLKQPHSATFKLDKPPEVLLDVQASLESDDADVGKIASRIENEPSLASYLTATATQSNRQKLQVSDVRHGLMMHGFERTRSLLIQQALVVRLNQHRFPLQDAFLQFCKLFSHLSMAVISVKRKSLAEQVSALAYFAATGLFTLPALKGQTVWRRQPNRLYDLNCLINLNKQGALLNHSLTMAKAWQQPASFVKAIGQHNVLPQQNTLKGAQADLAISLGLGVLLSRQILFDDKNTCKESKAYQRQASAHLGLSDQQLEAIRHEACSYCHVSCGLPA